MSIFIGIHDGHNASVAVVRDGRVELALQEERLTRVKNQGDEPKGAAKLAFQIAGTEAPVGLNGMYMNYNQWQRETVVRDYERSSAFAGRWKQPFKGTFVDRVYQRDKAEQRMEALARIGVANHRAESVEHHLAHASAAYHTAPWRGGKTLVLTCDGSGDRLSATVNIGEHGVLSRIASVSEHDSIGRLYAMVTRFLGMAPLEHEYKVMGLAPYVSSGSRTEAAAREFSSLFKFARNGMSWTRRAGVPSMYAAYGFLQKLLEGKRFDTIAAGVQKFIEDLLVEWVTHSVRETGIRRIACAGGVFMNVKANLALLEIPEVEDLYIFPSCGDESNSIGAACHLAARAGDSIQPLGPLYYGEPITDREAQDALEANSAGIRFRWHSDIERIVARSLAEGKIVARAKGAVEFGARALGNRSILARADSSTAVREINEMVKNRDFWMPFAPSVLAGRANDYYQKPKAVASPYMMFGFRSRPEKRVSFAAAQHPYDFTTRPHEVFEDHNPEYHRLLQEYETRTGEGILLNTSFNLHGEPIVYRACDAVDVFRRSGLRHMALANWWVEKA